MSALGAVLGKRTWLGAGAILLAAAGGCATRSRRRLRLFMHASWQGESAYRLTGNHITVLMMCLLLCSNQSR